jgi:phage baseplate assembly protein W
MTNNNYKEPISWPFLPVPQNGILSYTSLEQCVRDSIRIILTTRPGEQLMQPLFGAGLQDFVGEGNTVAVRRQIQSVILDSLQKYEPRITVDNVDVDALPNSPQQIHIKIYYRLLRTNAAQQVGVSLNKGWSVATDTTSA